MEIEITLFVFIFDKWKIKSISWIISDPFVIWLCVHIFMCEWDCVCIYVCVFEMETAENIIFFSIGNMLRNIYVSFPIFSFILSVDKRIKGYTRNEYQIPDTYTDILRLRLLFVMIIVNEWNVPDSFIVDIIIKSFLGLLCGWNTWIVLKHGFIMLDIIYLLCTEVKLLFLSWQCKFQYFGRRDLVIN